ncbi:hemin uptake protein HemP [Serratia sp. JSRIV001]|uniref:hemin uptake protein HemP n=1 Tax=Serratia TaxID=613 RepID=UPI001CBBE3FA|nr:MULTISPECIES: hemin uptake protein HemP [Serratia]UAN48178.1 hemin uptake protein HemP [Serratia sp. JSRIV001]CAI0935743.1 Hemin uptake protein [Serratia fonticola]
MDNLNNPPQSNNALVTAEGSVPASLPPCFDSVELLGSDGLAVIIHQGQRYQLRQTKAGKLILTK